MTDRSLLNDFIAESEEHLEEMEQNLLLLESLDDNPEVLNEIFRSAHSIKGSAEYMGFKYIANLSHALENLLEILRGSGKSLNKEIVEILMESRDRMVLLINDLQEKEKENTLIDDLLMRIDGVLGESLRSVNNAEDAVKEENPANREADDNLEPPFENRSAPGDQVETFDYEEETDDELFVIFMEHLVKEIFKIRSELKALIDSENDSAAVSTCLDTINSLRSSANYMDFRELVGLYENWIAEIKKYQESGTGASSLAESGTGYIDRIVNMFHGHREELEDKSGVVQPEQNKSGENRIEEDLRKNDYQEETDDELFKIFKDHLLEGIFKIRSEFKALMLPGNDSAAVITCLDTINSLRSSANYMDFTELVSLFENWIVEIEKYQEEAFMEDGISALELIESGKRYINSIIDLFPENKQEFEDKPGGITDILLEEDFFGINDSLQGLGTDEKENGEPQGTESVLELEHEDLQQDILEASIKENIPKEMLQEDSTGLFDELDMAFETFPQEGEISGDEAFPDDPPLDAVNGEMEDMLMGSLPGESCSKNEEAPGSLAADGVAAEKKETPEAPLTIEKVADVIFEDAVPVSPMVEKNKKTGSVPSKKGEGATKPPPYGKDIGVKKVTSQSVRIGAEKIDTLINQVGELVVNRASFSQFQFELTEILQQMQENEGVATKDLKEFKNLVLRLNESNIALGRVTNELQEGVMKIRMLPLAQLFNRYPRLIRDLTHGTDKKVNLAIKGEETELDKMVIQEIADPLVHIIRNAVDHGIEAIPQRKSAKKEEAGRIILEAYHEGNHVVITISDDGSGIDVDQIKNVALKNGTYSAKELETISEKGLYELLMLPGFSTSEKITKTSGRGVGMDVVKKNIEKLNGIIEIDSIFGKGTSIRIKLPLTLAIIKGLLVRLGKDIFTIPLASVEETVKVAESEISVIEGVEVIQFRETVLPLLRLADIFNIKAESKVQRDIFVVVINTGMKQMGLVVDALIGQEEVVIKPLADYLQENSGFSGATILGDGSISLIVDLYELINLSILQRGERKKISIGDTVLFDSKDMDRSGGLKQPYLH